MKKFELTCTLQDGQIIYIICDVPSMIWISELPMNEWPEDICELSDELKICAFDMIDGVAYYKNYTDDFPNRKIVVDTIDAILKVLNVELLEDN